MEMGLSLRDRIPNVEIRRSRKLTDVSKMLEKITWRRARLIARHSIDIQNKSIATQRAKDILAYLKEMG